MQIVWSGCDFWWKRILVIAVGSVVLSGKFWENHWTEDLNFRTRIICLWTKTAKTGESFGLKQHILLWCCLFHLRKFSQFSCGALRSLKFVFLVFFYPVFLQTLQIFVNTLQFLSMFNLFDSPPLLRDLSFTSSIVSNHCQIHRQKRASYPGGKLQSSIFT